MSRAGEASPSRDTFAAVWGSVGGEPRELSRVRLTGRDPALPSVFPVTAAASASVAAATLAAAGVLADRNREPLREVAIDALHAVIAFRSERHVRIIGGAPFGPGGPPPRG